MEKELSPVNIKVAGTSFDDRAESIVKMKEEDLVQLVPEPRNKYDPNAIAVLDLEDNHLGYIPKAKTKYFPKNEVTFGSVVRVFNEPGLNVGLTIRVYI